MLIKSEWLISWCSCFVTRFTENSMWRESTLRNTVTHTSRVKGRERERASCQLMWEASLLKRPLTFLVKSEECTSEGRENAGKTKWKSEWRFKDTREGGKKSCVVFRYCLEVQVSYCEYYTKWPDVGHRKPLHLTHMIRMNSFLCNSIVLRGDGKGYFSPQPVLLLLPPPLSSSSRANPMPFAASRKSTRATVIHCDLRWRGKDTHEAGGRKISLSKCFTSCSLSLSLSLSFFPCVISSLECERCIRDREIN